MSTIALLFVSCQKEEEVPLGSLITTFPNTGIHYKQARFNPLNSNEIIYFRRDYDNPASSIEKYNMATGERTVLVEDRVIISPPSWSSTGWIAFDNLSYNIWAVKDNGDSLHQVTTTTANLYPAWSPDGRTIYWHHTPTLAIPHFYFSQKFGAIGQMDTLMHPEGPNYGSARDGVINQEGQLAAITWIGDKRHVGVSESLDTMEFKALAEVNVAFGSTTLTGLAWSPDGRYIYISVIARGIYRVDVNTKELVQLISSEDIYRSYMSIDTSPDGRWLIVERKDGHSSLHYEDSFVESIFMKANLYLIHLETLAEIPLEIDAQ